MSRFEELHAQVEEAKRAVTQAENELLTYLWTTVEYKKGEEVEVYGWYGVGANRDLGWWSAKITGYGFITWGKIREDPVYEAVMKRKDGTWSETEKSYRPAHVRKVNQGETR